MNEITRAETWEALCAAHRWQMPARYNMAHDMCEKWAAAEPDRLALIYLRPDGEVRNYSYIQLSRASNRLANALASQCPTAFSAATGTNLAGLSPNTAASLYGPVSTPGGNYIMSADAYKFRPW